MNIKRKKLIYITLIIFSLIIYCGFYINARFNKEIIHFESYDGSGNHNKVEVVYPDGRLIFLNNSTYAEKKNLDLDSLLVESSKKIENNIKLRRFFYWPAYKTETLFWEIKN
tara:strand:- start:2736 stop:3071 length:336 start_codon:yes stop_codon:yes gene_type:complete